MKKPKPSKYHFVLLCAIPVLVVLSLFSTTATFDIQWHDTYFVMAPIQFALILSMLLGIKALFYWATRSYPLFKYLCYIDIVLTILLALSLLLKQLLPLPSIGLIDNINLAFILAFAFWILMQLFLFVNFFVHLLIRTSRTKK